MIKFLKRLYRRITGKQSTEHLMLLKALDMLHTGEQRLKGPFNSHTFVCLCINDAYRETFGKAENPITPIIEQRLKGETIESMLMRGGKLEGYTLEARYNYVQEYRRSYIMDLIKEYK